MKDLLQAVAAVILVAGLVYFIVQSTNENEEQTNNACSMAQTMALKVVSSYFDCDSDELEDYVESLQLCKAQLPNYKIRLNYILDVLNKTVSTETISSISNRLECDSMKVRLLYEKTKPIFLNSKF